MDLQRGRSALLFGVSVVSLLSSASVMLSLVHLSRKEMLKKPSLIVVFFIFLSNFLESCGSLIGNPEDHSAACWIQGIFTKIFSLSNILWTVVITAMLYDVLRTRTVSGKKNIRRLHMKRAYHVICWGIPIFVALIPLVNNRYGASGDYGWCNITATSRSYTWERDFWFWVSDYFWVWMSFVTIIGYLIEMTLIYRRLDPETASKVREVVVYQIGYPLVIFLCWMPIAVVDLVAFSGGIELVDNNGFNAHSSPSNPNGININQVYAFTDAMCCSKGLLNALFFWLTHNRERLDIGDLVSSSFSRSKGSQNSRRSGYGVGGGKLQQLIELGNSSVHLFQSQVVEDISRSGRVAGNVDMRGGAGLGAAGFAGLSGAARQAMLLQGVPLHYNVVDALEYKSKDSPHGSKSGTFRKNGSSGGVNLAGAAAAAALALPRPAGGGASKENILAAMGGGEGPDYNNTNRNEASLTLSFARDSVRRSRNHSGAAEIIKGVDGVAEQTAPTFTLGAGKGEEPTTTPISQQGKPPYLFQPAEDQQKVNKGSSRGGMPAIGEFFTTSQLQTAHSSSSSSRSPHSGGHLGVGERQSAFAIAAAPTTGQDDNSADRVIDFENKSVETSVRLKPQPKTKTISGPEHQSGSAVVAADSSASGSAVIAVSGSDVRPFHENGGR